jgi:hypothetical protein
MRRYNLRIATGLLTVSAILFLGGCVGRGTTGISWVDLSSQSVSACVTNASPPSCANPPSAMVVNPLAVAIDSTNVYIGTQDAIVYCPRANCARVMTIAAYQQVTSVAVDASFVYWTTGGGNVKRCALTSLSSCQQQQQQLATGQASPSSIALDPPGSLDNIYWLNSPHAGGGSVMSCKKAACSASVLVQDKNTPKALTVDGANIYWTDVSGAIQSCPKINCFQTTVTQASTGQMNPVAIASDNYNLYWANIGDETIRICTLPNAGGIPGPPACLNPPTIFASGQAGPSGIGIDVATVYASNSPPYVYWTNAANGTVMFCLSGQVHCDPQRLYSRGGGHSPTAIAVVYTN